MSFSEARPRPEYPRPDRQRGTIEGVDWLNLNGPWQFRFDGERKGVLEGWHLPDQKPWREQILVPFCWESLAAWGEGEAAGNENYYSTRIFLNPLEVNRSNHRSAPRYEVGWYKRGFEIPPGPAWEGKRIILIIGAADFFTDAWCNGVYLGRHEGGYTPFEFDLTDALRLSPEGHRSGLLAIRVEDPMDNAEQPVGKQWRWYTTVSGIWQTVYVEPRASSYIDSFQFSPDIEGEAVGLSAHCCGVESGNLIAEIEAPEGPRQRAVIPVRHGQAQQRIPVQPLRLWNPNTPFLYRTRLRLEIDGAMVDSVRTYFGMRKVDFAPAEDPDSPAVLRLNGVARYLRGALYQSYYPDGVYTARDVEVLKQDILYAKKVGFNFLRVHIKVDDPLLLYYADALGMLIMADFPNFGEGGDTPLGRRRYEEMMRQAIRRDFNHPSIFAWCLFNETWGFGGQAEFMRLFASTPGTVPACEEEGESSIVTAVATGPGAGQKALRVKLDNSSSHLWVRSMWQLAKQLDPTRLIEDMSVVHWEHLDYYAHCQTDINSWHFYINDYTKAKEHIEKVVSSTYPGSTFNYATGFQQQFQPLINSEYGGIGALDGDRDVSWSFKFLTNELRRHGAISAYIYTELHDVEWEYNGFLNYDRTPKDFGYDPRIINESDVLPIDAPPVVRLPPGTVVELPVYSSHYSTRRQENVRLRWRLSGIDTRGRLHQELTGGLVPIEFPHRRVALARIIQLALPEEPMLCTLQVEAFSSEGERIAQNFTHYFVSNSYPPLREESAHSLILRAAPAAWSHSQWANYSSDRETARQLDCSFGSGPGFFEWSLPLENFDLRRAGRLRVLCEASSRRIDTPQTDDKLYPSTLRILINGAPVFQSLLPNHPHDSRGALSYLRNGHGAYGYLVYATAEGSDLEAIARQTSGDHLALRIEAPQNALAQGGLSIYGAECGRYPFCPTLMFEY
jgi:hypothetical protein